MAGMIGFAVLVTVLCRWNRDARVRASGAVLVGRRDESGGGRRGARSWRDGSRERNSRGCRRTDIGAAGDG